MKAYKNWLEESQSEPRYLQGHEVPAHARDVLNNIKQTLSKHGIGARVSVEHFPKTDHHEIGVELGHQHVENERLTTELMNHTKEKEFGATTAGDVKVMTMASQHPAPKYTV